MQYQKLTTLCWRTFAGCGREHITIVFAWEGSQYLIYIYFQPIATLVTQDGKPKIVDGLLILSFSRGQWPCCCLFCLQRLPIQRLYITATKSHFHYHTFKTNNCWHFIDTHFNVLSLYNLLLLIIEVIMIWTYRWPFCLIKTWPFGKAEPTIILALVALIQLKFIPFAK